MAASDKFKDEKRFIVVAEITYRNGKTWKRAFGPFATRYKAQAFGKRLKKDNTEHYSQVFLDKIKLEVVPFWEVLNPNDLRDSGDAEADSGRASHREPDRVGSD